MSRRIVNLSLHRSGTQSFIDMCWRNNLRCLHWPGVGFDLLCRPALASLDTAYIWSMYNYISLGYEAMADLPMPLLFHEAMHQWPDAEFVLVQRKPADWVKSVRRHTRNRRLDVLEKFQYAMILTRPLGNIRDITDADLEFAYTRFNDHVIALARERRVKFSTFQLDDPELGQQIAGFLSFANSEFRQVDRTPAGRSAKASGTA